MKNLIQVDPKDLTFHPKNYNRHSETKVEELGRSLDIFDQYKNCVTWVDPDNDVRYVIAGEGLVRAALKRKLLEITVNDMSHLTEERAMALMLSDNLTATTDFDGDKVAEIVKVIDDVESVPGVTPDWLVKMLGETFDPNGVEFPEYDESVADEVKYIECPKCGERWPA